MPVTGSDSSFRGVAGGAVIRSRGYYRGVSPNERAHAPEGALRSPRQEGSPPDQRVPAPRLRRGGDARGGAVAPAAEPHFARGPHVRGPARGGTGLAGPRLPG